MSGDDNQQQPARPRWPKWRRWIGVRASHDAPLSGDEDPSVHARVHALPAQLDASGLPNGVVELLIEDFEESTRRLFDIHDGRITPVEPGAAVPWTCIAGSQTAWALALGPQCDTAALRLTGDTQLARRVLAALPTVNLGGP